MSAVCSLRLKIYTANCLYRCRFLCCRELSAKTAKVAKVRSCCSHDGSSHR